MQEASVGGADMRTGSQHARQLQAKPHDTAEPAQDPAVLASTRAAADGVKPAAKQVDTFSHRDTTSIACVYSMLSVYTIARL